ncbi:MAG: hypothetical protein ACKPHU_28435, partial [Planctomycetaceae bacterium]
MEHLSRTLLEAGAPFLLWTAISQDHVKVLPELEELCRWLVHRDRESWAEEYDSSTPPWSDRAAEDRPALSPQTSDILKKMFRTGQAEPWLRRDSRWLQSAFVVFSTTSCHAAC